MQIIAPDAIPIIDKGVDSTKLELVDDWNTKEYHPFVVKLYETFPPFIRNNFKIKIEVTGRRGGAEFSSTEGLITVRLPTVLIGRSMRQINFRDIDPLRDRELERLSPLSEDLIKSNLVTMDVAYAREIMADEDYLSQTLKIFEGDLRKALYQEILLHEYGHMIFDFIRKSKEIDFNENEKYLESVNANPSLLSEFEELSGELIDLRYGVENNLIVNFSNKVAYLYSKYLEPEDFYNFLKRRYFIILEEIVLRISEVIGRHNFRDNEDTAEYAVDLLNKEIFMSSSYYSWLIPDSNEFIDSLRRDGCNKTIGNILSNLYTDQEFIKRTIRRFPDLPANQIVYFESRMKNE